LYDYSLRDDEIMIKWAALIEKYVLARVVISLKMQLINSPASGEEGHFNVPANPFGQNILKLCWKAMKMRMFSSRLGRSNLVPTD